MGKKFVDADEAAKMLGISVDALNEMRDRHEVFPVRDGGQWKYKFDDVERLAADRSADSGSGEADYDEAGSLDSILLSEVELGHSGASQSSTVIGKMNEPSPESDMRIAEPKPQKLREPLSRMPESPSELPNMGSDVHLAGGSDVGKAGSGLSKKFDALDTLDLELPPALSSSGTDSDRVLKKKEDSGLAKKKEDSGILSLDDNALSLGEEPLSKLGGSSSKRRAAGSAIDLSGQDDDDLVLGSGSSGSDLTHSAGGDSGISLIDPSDSGLALDDDVMEAQGTNPGGTSLNLGGGDDDLILLEEEGDPNVATQLKADDDFLLTPMDDGGGQESDSGSQVIALDSESDFNESEATMIGGRVAGAGLLEPDSGDFGGGFAAAEGGPALGLAPGGMPLSPRAAAAMMEAPEVIEAPFSVFTVMLLLLCVLVLVVAGMMSYDLLRNMWSWDGAYSVNSSLMDAILSTFEK
jgi:hypothetical protein